MYTIGKYVLFFLTYSLLGALIETFIRFILDQQVYGIHGFLNLPLFPIYGFGALLIIKLLGTYARHPLPLFVGGALLATILEFTAHWLIELVFGDRIWDYSSIPLSIEGRVSLYSSIGFGLAAVVLVHFIHPRVEKVVNRLSKLSTIIAAAVISVVLLLDLVFSVIERLTT